MQTIMSVPVRPWTQRELRLNRSTARPASEGASTSGALIDAPAVGGADEAVDVVPTVLPVARDHLVGDLDPGEPLDALVAVHRRDVEPHRTSVVVRDVTTEHLQGDDDVGRPPRAGGRAGGVGAGEGGR